MGRVNYYRPQTTGQTERRRRKREKERQYLAALALQLQAEVLVDHHLCCVEAVRGRDVSESEREYSII